MIQYPKKKLFLHVGFPKTGSSAIQSLLAHNSELLKQQDYFYQDGAEAAKLFKISSGNGKVLLNYLNNSISELNLYFHYFQNEFPNVIISSEALRLNKLRLTKLTKFCRSFNIELVIVAYVRDIIPYAISAYHQGIKRHNSIHTFPEFLRAKLYIRHIDLAFLIGGGKPSPQAPRDAVSSQAPKGMKSEASMNDLDSADKPRDKDRSDKQIDNANGMGWEFKLIHYDSNKNQIFSSFCKSIGVDFAKMEIPKKRVNRSLTPTEVEALRVLNVCAKKSNISLNGYISDNLVNNTPNAKYNFAIKYEDYITIEESAKDEIRKFNQVFSNHFGFVLSLGDIYLLKANEKNMSEVLHLPTFRKCVEVFVNKFSKINNIFKLEDIKQLAKETSRFDSKAGEKISLCINHDPIKKSSNGAFKIKGGEVMTNLKKAKTKTIILHFGFHKTASTSIQATLANNNKFLLKKNFFFPKFSITKKAYKNHSFPFIDIFSQQQKKNKNHIKRNLELTEARETFSKQLEKYIKRPESLIFSGEGISILTKSELQLLRQKIESKEVMIRPIIFVREPISYFVSAIQQKLKGGSFTIEKGIEENFKSIDLKKIKKIKEVFPESEFYSFDEACRFPEGPVAFFLDLIGFNPRDFNIIKKNESVSLAAAQLLNYLNKRCNLLLGEKLNFTRTFKETFFLLKIKGPKFNLLRSEIEPLFNNLIKDRKRIEKIANIKFSYREDTLDNFPTEFRWDEESITSFIEQVPFLTPGILYRSYDYFYGLYTQNMLSKEQLDLIGSKINEVINNGLKLDKQSSYLVLQAAKAVMKKKPKDALQLLKLVEQYSNDAQVKDLINILNEKINKRKKRVVVRKVVRWLKFIKPSSPTLLPQAGEGSN